MMFLFDGMRAEVEPVLGREGWYQLTGREICRWTHDVGDTYTELTERDVEVNLEARLMGVHSFSEEIEEEDPRFNYQNSPDNPSFFVYQDQKSGKTYMILQVNRAEYALFRFLCPHAEGPEIDNDWDPIDQYRVEPAPTAS